MLVQAGIYDEFLERFTAAVAAARRRRRVRGRRPGRPADRRARAREGRAPRRRRARRVAPSSSPAASALEGQFFQPSILTGVTPEMRMSSEETFGPVAAIARFETEEEAIRIANERPYGLAAYYMTTRPRPHVARRRGARVRDPRGQHRPHLDRGGAVRRRQGVGHRPRGLELRRRRLGRAQVLGRRAGLERPADDRRAADYHVHTGKLPELVRLYADEGIAIQQEVLGGFVGAFTTDIGALSTYTHAVALRRATRSARSAAPRSRRVTTGRRSSRRIQPLIHTQQNRILVPTSFSPLAVATHGRSSTARSRSSPAPPRASAVRSRTGSRRRARGSSSPTCSGAEEAAAVLSRTASG